ncbi:hypothetical protein [Limobrevibacterium gyesilva]|uniref:Uncharacterized protein n=1 Tax=Limobrevibacterium gyesilva TaxID=2991712 RepID=A0AA41YN82_9PROT|nr:hypothetical protein [Limobrevibacterium gyesilva]MCW3476619.1 hypothetical protein [Limobrevibacterium gyesilva]
MHTAPLPFPANAAFPAADPPAPARDEAACRPARPVPVGAWSAYLQRVLPPLAPGQSCRAA